MPHTCSPTPWRSRSRSSIFGLLAPVDRRCHSADGWGLGRPGALRRHRPLGGAAHLDPIARGGERLVRGRTRWSDLDTAFLATLDTQGVLEVHDLHTWEFSSGKVALLAHVRVDETLAREESLEDALGTMLATSFGITHSTVPVELPGAHGGRDLHTARAPANGRQEHGHDHGNDEGSAARHAPMA